MAGITYGVVDDGWVILIININSIEFYSMAKVKFSAAVGGIRKRYNVGGNYTSRPEKLRFPSQPEEIG